MFQLNIQSSGNLEKSFQWSILKKVNIKRQYFCYVTNIIAYYNCIRYIPSTFYLECLSWKVLATLFSIPFRNTNNIDRAAPGKRRHQETQRNYVCASHRRGDTAEQIYRNKPSIANRNLYTKLCAGAKRLFSVFVFWSILQFFVLCLKFLSNDRK